MPTSKPYLGIALSGGTLKAAAHIGVLEALEKVGIYPDAMAGTSAGSLVSALYAHGYRSHQFRQLLSGFPGLKLVDYGFPIWSSIWSLAIHQLHPRRRDGIPVIPAGLMKGKKLKLYIERLLSARRQQIPLYIVATDLVSGRPVVFSATQEENRHRADTFVETTNLPLAIAGSCALPGIFTPVRLDPYLLVDGAMRHYVPVTVLEQMGCQKIIAVNLYQLPGQYEPKTLVDVLARSFDILLRESIDNDMVPSERVYVLEPDMSQLHWRQFTQIGECVDIGRQLAEAKMPELLAFLER